MIAHKVKRINPQVAEYSVTLNYLEMMLDFSQPGEVSVTMKDYIQMMIRDMPDNMVSDNLQGEAHDQALALVKDPDAFLNYIARADENSTPEQLREFEFNDGRFIESYWMPLQLSLNQHVKLDVVGIKIPQLIGCKVAKQI